MIGSAATISVASARPRPAARSFYIGVAALMLVLNVVSFAPSLLASSARTVPLPLTPLVMLHTVVAIAWLLLFLVQTSLASTQRIALHRRLGIAGVILAVAFAIVGWTAAVAEARRGFDLSGDLVQAGTTSDAALMLAPINQFVLFAGLVLAAAWYRRRPEVHKRLMVLAMVGPLAGAPLTHLVGHWPLLRPAGTPIATGAGFVLLSLNGVYDRVSQGRIHPLSLWGAGAVFVWGLFFFGFVADTSAWRDFSIRLLR